MNSVAKKKSLVELGDFFRSCVKSYENEEAEDIVLNDTQKALVDLIDRVHQENGWFTKQSVLESLKAWSNSLSEEKVEKWFSRYDLREEREKKVGVIMAGNLPLVGLHDALCVLISGNVLYAKLSSKDRSLMLLVLSLLKKLSSVWKERIVVTEQLKEIEILIATGSDNSARYFEYYFKDKKRIIRKNRTSVAVLSGNENEKELEGLSKDVFTHFGLGCRNVTKLYLPTGYDLDKVFAAFFPYKEIANHNKYANNYDYNKAVYLLNKVELIENGFILFKEDEGLHSPVGVMFYEFYDELNEVEKQLKEKEDFIQCVVSHLPLENITPFGKAQSPELWDYADGIDTIQFLTEN